MHAIQRFLFVLLLLPLLRSGVASSFDVAPNTTAPTDAPTHAPTAPTNASAFIPTHVPTAAPTALNPRLSSCSTKNGLRCIFPFKYGGNIYENCTDVDYTLGLWCATSVFEEGNLITGIDSWDACDRPCNISSQNTSGSSSGDSKAGEDVATQLLVVLVVAFLVILLGFSSVVLGWINASSVEIVAFLCGEVCLPILVFEGVAIADAGSVNWYFTAAVMVGKFFLLIATGIGAALSSKPGKRLTSAAIYGMFVTMSSDFGFGFPVMKAVFLNDKVGQTRTLMYVTLFSVLQDVVVNTVVIIMLEVGKARQSLEVSFGRIARTVTKEIVTNNIVIAGCAGMLYKAFLSGTLEQTPDGARLPLGVENIVRMFASPYDFLALFQVGTSVASIDITTLRASSGIGIASLSVLKVVISPLVIVGLVTLLPDGYETLNPESHVRDKRAIIFSFLFAAIPTAPGVITFAKSYSISTHILGPAVLVGLILSGPVMITLARIFQLLTNGVVIAGLFPMTIPGLIGAILTMCLFLAGGRSWLRLPLGAFWPLSLSMALYSACMLAMRHAGECHVSNAVFMLANYLRAHLTWFGAVLLASATIGGLISNWGSFLANVYGLPAVLCAIGFVLDGGHFIRYHHTPFCIQSDGFDVQGTYVIINGLLWLAMVFAAVLRSKRFAKPMNDDPGAARYQRMFVIPSQAMGLYSLLASTIHLMIAASWNAAPFAAMPLLIMSQSVQGYGGLILSFLFVYSSDAKKIYARLARFFAWLVPYNRDLGDSSEEDSEQQDSEEQEEGRHFKLADRDSGSECD